MKIRCANAKNDLHSFAVVCIIRVFTKLCSLLSIFFLPLYFSFSLFISLSHLPLAVSPLNFFLFHIGPKLHFAPFLFFHIPIAFVVFYWLRHRKIVHSLSRIRTFSANNNKHKKRRMQNADFSCSFQVIQYSRDANKPIGQCEFIVVEHKNVD